MATDGALESTVSYEELIQLEYEFNDAEDELGSSYLHLCFAFD
jgi:hypothetical protein